MTDLRTPRLVLHPVDVAEGQRIAASRAGVLADTDRANVASQRTLERAGFTRRRHEADLYFYEATVGTD